MSFLDKAKELATDLAEKAGPLKDKAAEVAGELAEKAGPLKDKAMPYVEQAGEAAAKGMDTAVSKLNEMTGGKFSDGVHTVSEKVENLLNRDKK
ncbi:MAG: antitoxin [Kutzneria sp.]|nr:antitoxin [Kutzneria sp.]